MKLFENLLSKNDKSPKPNPTATPDYCHSHEGCTEKISRYSVDVSILTNIVSIGKSFVERAAEPNVKHRNLTQDEIQACKAIFKDSIDYSKVRILDCWYESRKKKNSVAAITVGNWMFFPPVAELQARGVNSSAFSYSDDFILSNIRGHDAVFMHEMTHVWQGQLAGHAISSDGNYTWATIPVERGNFHKYGVEMQGEIIANYWLGMKSKFSNERQQQARDILKNFLKDPKNKQHLPDSMSR